MSGRLRNLNNGDFLKISPFGRNDKKGGRNDKKIGRNDKIDCFTKVSIGLCKTFYHSISLPPQDKDRAFALTMALVLIVFVLFSPVRFGSAQNIDSALQEQVLSATENYFVQLKNKNYAAVWSSLSAKSRAKIISDVRKENKKIGIESSEDTLAKDFAAGGVMAKAYWDSFLFVFNPDIVLNESKWEIGKVGSDEAEIVLQYKKSEKPAVLKLYRENGSWKFGLDESFGARSLNVF